MSPEQDTFIEGLFHKYFSKLTLYATSELQDPTRAQDVVQDAFHEAVLHIDDLMTHQNPGGWLMQTLKNKIRESERARRRYIRRFFSLDSDVTIELTPPGDFITEICESDDTSPMENIEQALTPEELHLLKRLIFDKASHLEVAEELGITVWTSQKRLERIRKKMREIFPERKKKK